MQKVGIFLFSLFLLFGIVAHASLVIADSDSVIDRNNSESGNSGSDSSEDDSTDDLEDEVETEDEVEIEDESSNDSEPMLISGRTKTESKEVIVDDNGCRIKIERKVEIERGKSVEVIKKKMECPDGRKVEVQFKRENKTVNGITKERIKYEVEGEDFEVELEDEMEVEEEFNGTEYKLKAKLKDGRERQIKIMPDRASEIAIARLKSLNFTVELREVGNGNETRVAYFAGTEKNGRFLGIFKTKVDIETEIDSETGEVIRVAKPWWALLVSGEDSDQTTDTEGIEDILAIYEANGTDTGNESDIAA